MSTMPTIADDHSFTGIAKSYRDGSVLLSVADDRICKLNGVGALTWMILEQSEIALSINDVVRELQKRFDAINAEGELWYDVPARQLHQDTERFMNTLVHKRLLRSNVDTDGRVLYRINDGISGTTSTTAAVRTTESSEQFESSCLADIKPLKRETLAAIFGLLAFDLLLHLRGFNALITKVEAWPIANRCGASDRETCRSVRATVDRAQMYYPKKAMCLQRSAVVTCLLRRQGIPAEMVLAAQVFPPKAHAWVEVLNEVVNDSPEVKDNYRVFRRL
jgi:Transglutaminase-like superfamily